MRSLPLAFVGALLCTSNLDAQVVSPLPDLFAPFTVGEPPLTGLAPVGIGMVPLPVLFAAGNPGFMIAPSTPPVAPGSPVALLYVLSLAPPVPGPALPYCSGMVAMTPPLALGFTTTFAGVTGPLGVPPVPLPLPPGLPPGLPGIIVMTIGIDAGAGCIFVTDGIRLGTI